MKKLVMVSAAVMLAAAATVGCQRSSPEAALEAKTLASRPAPKADENSDASESWLTAFELTERSGETFHSKDLAGQVHVVNFFFSSCPGPCRLENMVVQDLQKEFGDDGVKFVSITCDPENDNPETLQRYADLFNARRDQWFFLTGDLTYIRRVAAEMYLVALARQTHSEKLIVVDRNGEIRGRFHWNRDSEVLEMKDLIGQLLAEKAKPAGQEPQEAESSVEEKEAEAA